MGWCQGELRRHVIVIEGMMSQLSSVASILSSDVTQRGHENHPPVPFSVRLLDDRWTVCTSWISTSYPYSSYGRLWTPV